MSTSARGVVTGVGMTTPVGLTAAQSCAAVRAGISAIEELDFLLHTEDLETVPVMGCAVKGVTSGRLGLGRWTRLATAALSDLVDGARLTLQDLAAASLYIALPPATRGGVDDRLPQLLGARIAGWMRASGIESRTRTLPYGHAGVALAFEQALRDLETGEATRAVVCGVDSLIEPETLNFLVEKRRLKTDDQVDGFVPGEAAACLLLERPEAANARAARTLAVVDAVGAGMEPMTVWGADPSPSTGLTDAVNGALGQLADRGREIRLVVCDLNGETYRAREFGNVAARVLSGIPNKLTVWHPADCIGDTGAAAGAVSACVAVFALAKGYAKAERALVLASSDDGLRGAIALRRPQAES